MLSVCLLLVCFYSFGVCISNMVYLLVFTYDLLFWAGGLHAYLSRALEGFPIKMEEFDVDAVNMYEYPNFQNVSWWETWIYPGDCVFVPYK